MLENFASIENVTQATQPERITLTPTQPKTELIPDQSTSIWINPTIFDKVENIYKFNVPYEISSDYGNSTLQIDLQESAQSGLLEFSYFFVISTPFQSSIKNVSSYQLKTFWESPDSKDFFLWIEKKDVLLLESIFGKLKNQTVLVSEDEPEMCHQENCLRISGFETLNPRWKLVSIDHLYLFDDEMEMINYPLKIRIVVSANEDSADFVANNFSFSKKSNFDPDKLSKIILTGTTALSRGTAFQMEKNGVLFPAANIGLILKSADILHISHEVPMFDNCPSAVPLREEMRFCSEPYYIQLFTDLGVDVIELTGNHLMDWGRDAFLETLDLYQSYGFQTYGAGISVTQADQPLTIDDHGNKFVFLGCNVSGPDNIWVSHERAGVQKCDLEKLGEQIQEYRNLGYLPIVTFQHYEVDDFEPITQLKTDFWFAAEQGAVVVSGSQAHFPQGFDFVGDSFVHYGLGNLFFDQMANWYRKATIDIHYFYEGHYINTQVVSIINENQGQPRFMSEIEEMKFLNTMFEHSFYYGK